MRKLTPREAAERLGVAEKTLAMWRCQGIGPAYTKPSPARVRYTEASISLFEAARTFSSTAQEAAARERGDL